MLTSCRESPACLYASCTRQALKIDFIASDSFSPGSSSIRYWIGSSSPSAFTVIQLSFLSIRIPATLPPSFEAALSAAEAIRFDAAAESSTMAHSSFDSAGIQTSVSSRQPGPAALPGLGLFRLGLKSNHGILPDGIRLRLCQVHRGRSASLPAQIAGRLWQTSAREIDCGFCRLQRPSSAGLIARCFVADRLTRVSFKWGDIDGQSVKT